MGVAMGRLTIFQAMKKAIDTAVSEGRSYYVLPRSQGPGYYATHRWAKGWLFHAYPGGRKVLSMAGKELVDTAVRNKVPL